MKAGTRERREARPRIRMLPQMRREMILEGAVAYFADHGFEVQIRQFAREIGISPALVFKYFDNKDALIEAVYQAVFEARWKAEWLEIIGDRSRPLAERLVRFYDSYLATVDDRNWIRIAMRASLDGSDLTRRYLSDHVDRIMALTADEIDEWFGPAPAAEAGGSTERAWHLHSTVIYFLIRKHIHQVPVMEDRELFVRSLVGQFLGRKARSD